MQKIETKNFGPIVGTLIVIVVLVAAALYVFASHINRQALINSDTASSTITIQMSGDDVQSLKNDLNNAIK